ncbi:hypothetical protein [Trinickia mobilis]|uniref:hypothetical protein n=1 Tax=Trinickia mobilis TaxID=2816356 RepID=UPI001A8EC353|nr:hypothetical protein [Trinickia mobilis]
MKLTSRAAGAFCVSPGRGYAAAQSTLYVYGPSGPAPAIRETAAAVEKQTETHVEVTAGPTPSRTNHARTDADLIYGGAETMMSDLLVVNGAGHNGGWEDVAGHLGDIRTAEALRRNIVIYANNSALARQTWISRPGLDAWLIWNIRLRSPTFSGRPL